ncbi:MAG TPA: TRAP transporter large permease [Candidatus Aerophobetes bacterium]|uniref:TRAP transporter large permease n=1 Tax=Aerophobetes bacterium TaxID=2030807 RepID=A0A7V5LZL7_UNCAE|nr:TRAP transporter large permease [Candidatus Aerophobetes bacterium]
MAVAVWLISFAAIFAMGYPIGFGMLISSALYLLLSGIDLATIMDMMVIKFESQFVLLAVPLFIFTAKVMNAGKITDRVFDFAKALVGPVKGGLGYVNIIASIIFAGMTGSELSDVAGLGAVEIKAMKDAGYDGPFSCAVTCASATIGPIIPPSIPMVIYSMLSGASVGYLFLGGFIPGLLLGGVLMLLVYILSVKRNYPAGKRVSFREFLRSIYKSFFALVAPVILLGGIYGGVFTPTEAAGVVSVYALVLSLFVYRTLGLKALYKVLIDTVLSTGFVSFLVAGAFIFGYVVAREEIPALITNAFISLGLMSSKWTLLLSLNLLFIVLGCFIDVSAILLIIVPIVLPLVKAAGIDLVHFGVVCVLNLMIALDTPPYGETLFITSAISDTPFPDVVKEMLLFIAFEIGALMICTYIPETVLWLPRLAGYQG